MRLHLDVFGDVQMSRELILNGDRGRDLSSALESVLGLWRDEVRTNFQSQGAHASGGWKPLAPSTKARKRASKDATVRKNWDSILFATEDLYNSLTRAGAKYAIADISDGELTYGTSRPFAGVHQNGGGHVPQRRVVELTEQTRADSIRILQDYLMTGRVRGRF